MVRPGTKRTTSHRQKLGHKYKVEKRVAEHKRRVKRGRLPAKGPPKSQKDPGLPNLAPFKEQFVQRMQAQKERMEESRMKEQDKRRAQRLAEQRAAAKAEYQQQMYGGMGEDASMLGGGAHNDGDAYAAMLGDADARAQGFAASGKAEGDADTSWTEAAKMVGGNKAALYALRETSRKTYYREFKRIVELADVVLEVLDARDPIGCRCVSVEERILRTDPRKRIILVLNKIDLVPRENVEAWLRYLRNEYPTVAFKCATSQGGSGRRTQNRQAPVAADQASDALLQSSECLGADTLLHILKNYCRSKGLKKAITVGIIGYPNVGKSSLINSLKRSRAAGVGSTPGLTKTMQTVTLDKNIKLLDCPGIVFHAEERNSNSDAAVAGSNAENDIILRNCVRIEQVVDPEGPVHMIVKRCQREALLSLYEIPDFKNAHHFLQLVARKRGKVRKGGVPNVELAARSVLQDWNSGRIAFYTQPPQEYVAAVNRSDVLQGQTSVVHTEAAVVTEWAQEFDIDAIDEAVTLDGAGTGAGGSAVLMTSSAVAHDDAGMLDGGGQATVFDAVFESAGSSAQVVRSRTKKERGMADDVAPQTSGAEIAGADIAPQINQQRRKQLRKEKAAAKRAASGAVVDSAYDFEDFFPLAGGMQDGDAGSSSDEGEYGGGVPDTDLAMGDV